MSRWRVHALLVLLLWSAPGRAVAADQDPTAAWRQGRAADGLAQAASTLTSRSPWQRWYDAGRLAAAAGEPGVASAAWLAAFRRAPSQPLVLAGLRITTPHLPRTCSERLGHLDRAARQPWALILAAIAGIACGVVVAGRAGWILRLGCGGVVVLALLPGIAAMIDAARPWCVVRVATTLHQQDGRPMDILPAGVVVRAQAADAPGWMAIVTFDGRAGLVSDRDLDDGRGALQLANDPGTTGWSPIPPAR